MRRLSPLVFRRAPALGARLLVLAVALGACGDEPADRITGPMPGQVAVLQVSAPEGVFFAHDTLSVTATATDAAGRVLSHPRLVWSSSDTSVARVDAEGRVQTVAPGRVVITATTADGRRPRPPIDGKPGPAWPEAARAQVDLVVSEGAWIGAEGGTARRSDGVLRLVVPAEALGARTAVGIVPLSSSAPPGSRFGYPSRSADDSDVVAGTAHLVATAATAFARPATLELEYVPSAVPAQGRDSALALFVWTGTEIGAATRAIPGNPSARADVEAWREIAESRMDPATHRVNAPVTHGGVYALRLRSRVARLQLSAEDTTLVAGGTLALRATPLATSGAVLDRPVSWRTSNAAVATIDSAGLLTAEGPGTATVTALSAVTPAAFRLSVGPAPAGAITVQPASASLEERQQVSLVATVRDVRGRLTDRPVWWSSLAPAVALVDSGTGAVRARAPGQAVVVGHCEGALVEVPVTVGLATPRSLNVTRAAGPALTALALAVDDTVALDAVARDALGTVLLGRSVGWQTDAPGVARVDTAGRLVAVGVGAATVTASVGGLSSAVAVTVTPAPAARVEIASSPGALLEGEGRAVGHRPRPGRPRADRPGPVDQ